MKMIWYGNAGHFIGSRDCQFHLCTEVNGYLVSTIGEYYPHNEKTMESLGLSLDSFYETMVFRLSGSRCKCGCGLPDINLSEIDRERYSTPKEANEKHLEYCKKYMEMKSK